MSHEHSERPATTPAATPATPPTVADYQRPEYDGLHARATRKVFRHLMPILLFAYFMAFVDRTNVGLAKDRLEVDVGLSATAYGLGAGIFFISYALLEVPSNLILHKIGARLWIARIAVTWGLLSSAMMFVNGPLVFYILRFLLGAAEAGLFPGLMYLITVWFAQRDRAKAVGIVLLAASAALMIANPIGGGLMLLDGTGGLHGWQWMFLIEGIPPVLIGLWILIRLPNGPREARWLTDEEQSVIEARAEDPTAASHEGERPRVIVQTAARKPFLLLIALIYFLNQIVTYGVIFFVPSIVGTLQIEGQLMIGIVSGIVFAGSFVGALAIPKLNSRIQRPVLLILIGSLALAALTVPFLLIDAPIAQMVLMTAMAFCITGVQPLYWSLAMGRVTGVLAAAGLALINTIGLVGGFVGPYLFGIAEDLSGSPSSGMVVVGVCALIGAVLVLPLAKALRRTRDWRDKPTRGAF